jgi:hypothetical protein
MPYVEAVVFGQLISIAQLPAGPVSYSIPLLAVALSDELSSVVPFDHIGM